MADHIKIFLFRQKPTETHKRWLLVFPVVKRIYSPGFIDPAAIEKNIFLNGLFILPKFFNTTPYSSVAGCCKSWFFSIIFFNKFFLLVQDITMSYPGFRMRSVSDSRMRHTRRPVNSFCNILLPFFFGYFFNDQC